MKTVEQRREALEMATKITTNPSDLIVVAREIAAFLFDDASASARAAADGKRQRIYGKMTDERKKLAAHLLTTDKSLSYRKVASRVNKLPGRPVSPGAIGSLARALGLPPREQSPKVKAMMHAKAVLLARKNAPTTPTPHPAS